MPSRTALAADPPPRRSPIRIRPAAPVTAGTVGLFTGPVALFYARELDRPIEYVGASRADVVRYLRPQPPARTRGHLGYLTEVLAWVDADRTDVDYAERGIRTGRGTTVLWQRVWATPIPAGRAGGRP